MVEDARLSDVVEEELGNLTSVPVQISDVVIVNEARSSLIIGDYGGYMIPVANADLIMEAEADLARGLTVVRHDATTFSVAT